MSTLTRLVVWELLTVLTLWLTAITLFMLITLLGMEAQRAGIGLGPILKLVPFLLPQAMAYSIPATVLLSVCVVYGRIAAGNEVTALKSLGIAPPAVAKPALILGFVLSLVCVWLNDIAFSWGEVGAKRVIMQSVEEILYGVLRTQRSYSNQKISISVRDVEDRRLIRPVISFFDELSLTITAEEAELQSNLENNTLKLILLNSVIDGGGNLQGEFPGRIEREIPLSIASSRGDLTIGPAQLSLRKILGEELTKQRRRIRDIEQSLAADAAFTLLAGDIYELHEAPWKTKRQKLVEATNRLYRLQAEPWRRTAAGAMCLFFTLVGLPVAILWRKADYISTFSTCFLGVTMPYFVLFFLCLNLAKSGTLPAAAIWLPNVVCAFIGWKLWKWVDRY